jgi:hypothetical protein
MIFFSMYLILAAALGPGVYSALNRNKYRKQKNNVKIKRYNSVWLISMILFKLSLIEYGDLV